MVSVPFLILFRLSVFELLDVALLDLLHEIFAIKEVTEEIRGELPRDDEKLIVGDLGKRHGTTRGNHVRAPLEHQANVPESQKSKGDRSGGERSSARMEELRKAIEKDGESENK